MIVLGIILIILGFVSQNLHPVAIGIVLIVIGRCCGYRGRWDTRSAAAATTTDRPPANHATVPIRRHMNRRIAKTSSNRRAPGDGISRTRNGSHQMTPSLFS